MEDEGAKDGGMEEGNWRRNNSAIVNTTGSVLFAMADFLFYTEIEQLIHSGSKEALYFL